MKMSASVILTLALAAQVTLASPSIFSRGDKKNGTKTEMAPSTNTLSEGFEFWSGDVTLRKPQFEKFDVCESWAVNAVCPTLFSYSCSGKYCAKTRKDCAKVSRNETFYYCDIFASSEEEEKWIKWDFVPRTGLTYGDYPFTESEKVGVERVAAGLCSPVSRKRYNCPVSVYHPCGSYCAKSEEACQLVGRIFGDYLGRYRVPKPLRQLAKPCDTFMPQVTSQPHEEKSQN